MALLITEEDTRLLATHCASVLVLDTSELVVLTGKTQLFMLLKNFFSNGKAAVCGFLLLLRPHSVRRTS